MKDFFGKATFGFLMAQLFPGAVAVLGMSFLYFQLTSVEPDSLLGTIRMTVANWSQLGGVAQLFLLGSCIGAGMLIHGIHWGVIGYFECRTKEGSIFDSFWHDKPLVLQIILGPIKIIVETVFFFGTRNIRQATIEENAVKVGKDHFASFEFLQEFYLYPGQFFAHTAYGLLIWISGILSFIFVNGTTNRRGWAFISIYLLCGLCFVLGRLQLRSLFSNEEDLVTLSKSDQNASGKAGSALGADSSSPN